METMKIITQRNDSDSGGNIYAHHYHSMTDFIIYHGQMFKTIYNLLPLPLLMRKMIKRIKY